MDNQFGKISKLNLTASFKDDRTILSDVSFTAPFKVMRPLYMNRVPAAAGEKVPADKNERFMTVIIMTASAGIMAGDRQEMTFCVEEGADMELTSQAYEKIHRMKEGFARRDTTVSVAQNACLHYTPLPTIPFAGSDFRSAMEVDLFDESSRFVYREVLTCGRAAHGEEFGYSRFQNRVRIRMGGRLVYRDNTLYEPERMDMAGFGMYEGFTHLANLVICNEPKSEEWMTRVRTLLDDAPGMEGGATRTACGFPVVRILGRSGEKLTAVMDRIMQM